MKFTIIPSTLRPILRSKRSGNKVLAFMAEQNQGRFYTQYLSEHFNGKKVEKPTKFEIRI